MASKSFGEAWRAGTSLSGALFRSGWVQGHSFSTSASTKLRAVAFTETSTPELDAVLERIRQTILIPSYLPLSQRRRLFSPKWKQKLRNDPITMEIDGEELKLTGLDILRDIPNTRSITLAAVRLMQTRTDFNNLARLLEGLHGARRTLKPRDYASITMAAGNRGCIYTIIDCARNWKRTGFKLQHSQPVNEILAFVQQKAIDSGWDEATTKQALLWSEMVTDMLDEDAHRRERELVPEEGIARLPLNQDPQILAPRMHLAAAVAVKHNGGVDADGKVGKYAKQMLAVWPAGTPVLKLHPPAAYKNNQEMYWLVHPNKLVFHNTLLLHGLDMAMQVVEPELAAELKSRRDVVAAEVEVALASAAEGGRGRSMYNKLYGPEAAEGTEEAAGAGETV